MMEPLFEEDWLHENNLDILFDLFEEEIESKIGTDSNNDSSTLFGTSPVTSCLFGTSPSLASALDLLYFDNQQQQPTINNLTTHQQTTFTYDGTTSATATSNSSTSHSYNQSSNMKTMRIKRGMKRGQSEGISLLAKPSSSGNSNKTGACAKSISDKTRAKITTRQNQQQQQQQKRERFYPQNCQRHVHYITGHAVIHEHAYALYRR